MTSRAHAWLTQVIVAMTAATAAVVHADARGETISFDWFEYTGRDAVFEQPLPSGHYRNPILAGFYPDPSITRAADRFYLVNSTFAFFPGIPVFESRDLVHWTQIGNAIDRPSQLNFAGLGVSRGVFAPTIEHHDGVFYIFNTHVDAGGNYVITARDPAGPWSDPTWLPDLEGGIDPSMFVDEDGRAYVLNNGPPEGPPKYAGHRAIWIQEFDRAALKTKGPRKVLVDGGIDLSRKPIWIEGPHLLMREGWYYLSCAEGGTGPQHSQVILRSRSPWGPFTPGEINPILTQRDLPVERANPVTNAGHADLVQAPDGSWWATFLASRTYGDGHYNTGRETFLLPVTWRDGWPLVLERGKSIPAVVKGPDFMDSGAQSPLSGNFTWRDDFGKPDLDLAWLRLRTAERPWFDLKRTPGVLVIESRDALDRKATPAFLARRQQHLSFDASLSMRTPTSSNVAAGLLLFQDEMHWLLIGVRRKGGALQVFVEKQRGEHTEVVASESIASLESLELKVTGEHRNYSFLFRPNDRDAWRLLKANEDGSTLSSDVAGGFVGAVMGPYVRNE
ncbi:glycoside hydrolase family 43 protein [Povalibacter sp.]|uniref:glycoside hydrolase family 43 protein n=1 Tax=Povalibacter sp. TaxID=1962978 RepID=UPI002F3EDFEF